MRNKRVWRRLAGVESAVIEWVECEHDGSMVVGVRPRRGDRNRCIVCKRRCPGYDGGGGRRRWHALNLGVWSLHVEAYAPRVRCPEHGVVAAAVPWARASSEFTRAFEDKVGWLATHTDKTTAR